MKKILVVDKHPTMLEFITRLLEDQGHEVITVQDGLAALDVLKIYLPDVIFVDMVMPNIAGEKLCRIIRGMPDLKDVYIIILSGIIAEQKVNLDEIGADLCIAKGPFDKMAQHVLSALEHLGAKAAIVSSERILGLDDVFARETSKDLLSLQGHLERILNNMSEGIVELNPEARIIYANPAAVSLIGLSEEKLLSLSFIELFQDDHQQIVKDIIEGIDDKPNANKEDASIILNGKEILLNNLQINGEDNRTTILILSDITEQKRIEAQLREAQNLESLATLAGGIAHQFNNALSVITGNAELLKMSLPDEYKDIEFIEPIRNSAYRMSHFTSQLLAYARGGRYNPKVVSLSSLIEDTLPLIQHSINPSITVEKNLPYDDLYVEADLTQMQMVLSAAVNNAAEAIESQGYIKIAATRKIINEPHPCLDSGRYACLTIEDNGKGMDEKTKIRIFEPFFTTSFQGRGLGMAAVYGIVRNHGGWISVDSESGKGTTVSIYLPAMKVVETETEKKEPELEEGSGTILVIDDEDMILDVCRTMLEKLSYSVLEAKTGEEAMNVAKTHRGHIDLAILDIGLPDMDGDKLYKSLKEIRKNLKVIVCSGYAIDGPVQEIMDAGAQAFIQKPFSLGALSAKLREVLEG